MFCMKKIDAKKFAQAFVEAADGQGVKEVEKIAAQFVSYLAKNRLLIHWREIVRRIDGVWREKYGVANVSVKSAHSLSEKSRRALEKLAQGAEISETVDPELIGGAIIRVDDRIIDGSVLGALNNLKQVLVK